MKKLFIHFNLKNLLIIGLLLGGVACSQVEPSYLASNGKKIKLSNFHGKWIVINYWAKWCRPCVKEIPELNAFATKHKNTVVVLGVSFDHLTRAELQRAKQEFKFNYPLLEQDPSKHLKLGSISVVPMTVIINPQGKVKKHLYGPQTVASLEQAIK